jgi:Protein of unknown function (DUF3619)
MNQHDEKTITSVKQALDESTHRLDDAVLARLEHARQQALHVHQLQMAEASQHKNGVLSLFSEHMLHHRRGLKASLFVLSAILVALMITQQYSVQDTSVDDDAVLLGGDLPPEAFLDKGFDKWLEQEP